MAWLSACLKVDIYFLAPGQRLLHVRRVRSCREPYGIADAKILWNPIQYYSCPSVSLSADISVLQTCPWSHHRFLVVWCYSQCGFSLSERTHNSWSQWSHLLLSLSFIVSPVEGNGKLQYLVIAVLDNTMNHHVRGDIVTVIDPSNLTAKELDKSIPLACFRLSYIQRLALLGAELFVGPIWQSSKLNWGVSLCSQETKVGLQYRISPHQA